MTYDTLIPYLAHVFTVEEFREHAGLRDLIDYDGVGYPARAATRDELDTVRIAEHLAGRHVPLHVNGLLMDRVVAVYPSGVDTIPDDATHIVWFNR